jgi:hypothetical protein
MTNNPKIILKMEIFKSTHHLKKLFKKKTIIKGPEQLMPITLMPIIKKKTKIKIMTIL